MNDDEKKKQQTVAIVGRAGKKLGNKQMFNSSACAALFFSAHILIEHASISDDDFLPFY